MNRSVIITISFIFYGICFGAQLENFSEWKNILHYSSDNLKEVVAEDFYLTNSLKLEDEVKKFKEILSSEGGNYLACAFPARYLLALKTFKDLRHFELQKCLELQKFIKSFKSKNLSLLMTSELLNAPASAFGHVLLVLHNNEKPEMDSDVIHFSAITDEEDGFFKYARKGLMGGYFGYYMRNKFFEKYHEYSSIEQRYLFNYKLNITEKQKELLFYHLFELRKAKFDYYFLNQNCGYRLDKLLGIIFKKDIPDNLIYTLPIETPLRYENTVRTITKIPPYSIHAKTNIKKLNEEEKKKFDLILDGKKILDKNDSSTLKNSVFYYYSYNFKKNQTNLPNYKVNLDHANVEFNEDFEDTIESPLKKQYSMRFSFGGGASNSKALNSLSLRPVLIDINQFQKYNLHESELSILNFMVTQSSDQIEIQELNLLSVKVLSPSSEYFKNISWQGNISLNRENPIGTNALNSQVGLGKTYDLLGKVSMFLNLGGDSNKDFGQAYLRSEIYYINYFGKLKLKIDYSKKFYAEESMEILSNRLTYLFNKSWDFGITQFETKKQKIYLLEVSKYF